ncbi:MAG: hypothetical protein L0H41_07190 [Microlunatus sp.]|nr:hypothetical protein [Microlunatus sp.]MDN5769607.1 hypothetical protein [Microlunatus sp.]MDN5804402.1 hypothetical protein [Microlunatus sp.]
MKVLEVFAPLFGHWQGSEEQCSSRWGPATTARSALSFRADVGGAAMVSDYRQVRADGSEFYAHGVFLVDDALQVSCWLFDSYGYPPGPLLGGWVAKELVLTKSTERGTATHRFLLDGEDLRYAIDFATGEQLEPFLRGRYRAVSAH